jgi:hypothetical protein
MNACAGALEIPEDFVWTPDPEQKAREFGVDQIFPNTGHRWTFDQGEIQGGRCVSSAA